MKFLDKSTKLLGIETGLEMPKTISELLPEDIFKAIPDNIVKCDGEKGSE